MQQDFFKTLPPEITINILSRLPVGATMGCKCVCKPWLNLLETPEFAKVHFSKSVPGLAVFRESIFFFGFGETTCSSKPYEVLEFVDEPSSEAMGHCKTVFDFSFPHPKPIYSSADGFLLLFDKIVWPHNFFICNPITHDFIKIPSPPQKYYKRTELNTLGFGVSRMSGQYKVLGIFNEASMQSVCQVYTLGTGSWRSIAPRTPLVYGWHTGGTSLNGNFHWLAHDSEGSPCISCFDIETEFFSTFSSPGINGATTHFTSLSALGERLSLCDNSAKDVIVIWFMNEYGDGNSWTKECIINKMFPNEFYGILCPIKVFEDGDIFIAREGSSQLLCYCNKTKTIRETALIELRGFDVINAVIYTPSFLPLKTFAMENVSSF